MVYRFKEYFNFEIWFEIWRDLFGSHKQEVVRKGLEILNNIFWCSPFSNDYFFLLLMNEPWLDTGIDRGMDFDATFSSSIQMKFEPTTFQSRVEFVTH